MNRGHAWILFVVAAVTLDCATLSPLASSTCGNGVVDSATEDCDSFPAATCGKPTDGVKACRLTCDRKQAGSCPTGWGCSVDGFCRQATGSLGNAGAPQSAGAASLITGDFDGDGRIDIVGAPPYRSGAASRVHFFDNDANLATTASIQVPIQLPVIKDFNRDGIEDLGFSVTGLGVGGFGAMSGRRDRTFSAILFPAITIPKLLARPTSIHAISGRTALPGFNRSCVVAVTETEGGNRLKSFCGDGVGGSDLDLTIPFGPTGVLGSPQTGIVLAQFTDAPLTELSICGEVVVGVNSGEQGKLFMVSPCEAVTTGTGDVKWIDKNKSGTEVATPGKLLAAPLLVDLNGDRFDDIIVLTNKPTAANAALGATSGVYYALSKKTGLDVFEPLLLQGSGVPKPAPENPTEMVLAAADLNVDGAIDYVFPSGAAISSNTLLDGGVAPSPTYSGLSPTPRDGTRWSDVHIGRFNADSLLDMLVMYPSSLDVELLGNAGDGLFTRYVIRSDQEVREIVNGDFDGDQIQDVAFLQSPRELGDTSSKEIDLVLAYGKATGGPDEPQVIGRFTNARAVSMLHDASSGVDNLAVMESFPASASLPTAGITVIFGSGGRQAIAPLFMRDEDAQPPYPEKLGGRRGKTRIWAPVVLAAGALQAPDSVALISIATGLTINFAKQPPTLDTPFPTGVWLAPSNPNAPGGLGSFIEVNRITDFIAGVDVDKAKNEQILESAIVATIGDIDTPPNGIDEVVNVARSPANQSGVYVVRAAQQDQQGDPEPRVSVKLPDVRVGGGDPIALSDVNGDGAPDLTIITTVSGKRKLLVLLNNRAGGFVETPITMEIPEAGSIEPGAADDPLNFAPFITGARGDTNKPQRHLAVITNTRLIVAKLKPDGSAFEVEDQTRLLASDTKTSTSLTGIASGDFDGDGVEDVAVAVSGSIRILRQTPRLK